MSLPDIQALECSLKKGLLLHYSSLTQANALTRAIRESRDQNRIVLFISPSGILVFWQETCWSGEHFKNTEGCTYLASITPPKAKKPPKKWSSFEEESGPSYLFSSWGDTL